jgi:signal transduction histidine kinase
VEGLLALARADAATEPPATVDLAALARRRVEHWAPLAQERGLALTANGRPSQVRSSTGRLTQILDNLIANALDAARSDVHVTTEGSVLRVADDGPGMSGDERARAFDRFWTTRSDGSGLGLAIVKRLVEADGGDVCLQSRSTGGLEAVVRLRGA